MAIKKPALLRMDSVGIVVEDLQAASDFFIELGLELAGETTVEGQWVDRIVALDGVICDIAVLQTPDGHNRLELMQFRHPAAIKAGANTPNTLGMRRLMFAVEDLRQTLSRLQAHGAELVGEVVQYKDLYLLCFLRGPEGLIIALAEPLHPAER